MANRALPAWAIGRGLGVGVSPFGLLGFVGVGGMLSDEVARPPREWH